MKVQPVLAQNVNQVWPRVEALIAKGLDYSAGDYNTEHAKIYLTSGQWQLLVVTDDSADIIGVVTVEYFNRPDNRVAFVTTLAGRFLTSREAFDQARDIFKSYGATKIECASRDSAARLWRQKFGLHEKYKILEVSL